MMTFFVGFFFFNYPQEEGSRVLNILIREMGEENIRRGHFPPDKKKRREKKAQYDFNEVNICGCLWVLVCDFCVFLVDRV